MTLLWITLARNIAKSYIIEMSKLVMWTSPKMWHSIIINLYHRLLSSLDNGVDLPHKVVRLHKPFVWQCSLLIVACVVKEVFGEMFRFQTDYALHLASTFRAWENTVPTTPEFYIHQCKSILLVGSFKGAKKSMWTLMFMHFNQLLSCKHPSALLRN